MNKFLLAKFGSLLALCLFSSAQLFSQTTAEMRSPAPGSTLNSTSVTFSWSAPWGADYYDLVLSSAGGAYGGIRGSSPQTTTSVTVFGLPSDGRQIQATLWARIGGQWYSKDYVYTATGSGTGGVEKAAELISPTPGSRLVSDRVSFSWTAPASADLFDLVISSASGAYGDVRKSSPQTAKSVTAIGLPRDGREIIVTLWARINGEWKSSNYSYFSMNGGSVDQGLTVEAEGLYFTGGQFASTANSTATQQNAIALADGYLFVTFYRAVYAQDVVSYSSGEFKGKPKKSNGKYQYLTNANGTPKMKRFGQLVLARKPQNGLGSWEYIVFGERTSSTENTYRDDWLNDDSDAHRTANIAVSYDGRIHLAWGHHADPLSYKVTKSNYATTVPSYQWNASLFEVKRDYLNSIDGREGRFTYPRFVLGQNNTLQLFWRGDGGSGNADNFFANYMGNGTWSQRRRIVDGMRSGLIYEGLRDALSPTTYAKIPLNELKARSAYFNDIVYRNGRIHLSWTWREVRQNLAENKVTNHDLNYAYSSDGGITWNNVKGQRVIDTNRSQTFTLNTDVKFKDLLIDDSLDNQNGQTVDNDGTVHILWRYINRADSSSKGVYHLWKTKDATSFQEVRVPFNSSQRPKIYADPSGNRDRAIYAVSVQNTSTVKGIIRVYKATKNDNWASWSQIYSSGSAAYQGSNGVISSDGSKLFLISQRTTATSLETFSPIDVITINL